MRLVVTSDPSRDCQSRGMGRWLAGHPATRSGGVGGAIAQAGASAPGLEAFRIRARDGVLGVAGVAARARASVVAALALALAPAAAFGEASAITRSADRDALEALEALAGDVAGAASTAGASGASSTAPAGAATAAASRPRSADAVVAYHPTPDARSSPRASPASTPPWALSRLARAFSSDAITSASCFRPPDLPDPGSRSARAGGFDFLPMASLTWRPPGTPPSTVGAL